MFHTWKNNINLNKNNYKTKKENNMKKFYKIVKRKINQNPKNKKKQKEKKEKNKNKKSMQTMMQKLLLLYLKKMLMLQRF